MNRGQAYKAESLKPTRAILLSPRHEYRELLGRALTRLGCQVVASEAESSHLSRAQLFEYLPEVLFLIVAGDLNQQAHSIGELASRIWPLPLVVVADSDDPATIVKAAHLGAAAYMPAYMGEVELERSLVRTLEHFHSRPEIARCSSCQMKGTCYRRGLQALKGGPAADVVSETGRYVPLSVLSPAMRAIEKTVLQLSGSDLTVLITGESGTGKEVVARRIHECSDRSKGPFVKINCAALPEQLLESELFGHEKGAFTGASSRRVGKFESANRGIIFLDEISEMSSRLQAKLLHVLQDKEFTPLGGNRHTRVDVQVLAASNRDLEREVEAGRFREDLYFRINVIELHVPALRDRREDIPVLVNYFICHLARHYKKPVPNLSERFLNLLYSDRWPGNVRELENTIKRVIILGEESSVLRELLQRSNPIDWTEPTSSIGYESGASSTAEALGLKEVGRRAALVAERDLILTTLDNTRWNRRKASQILAVSYKTLLTKMKDFGLSEG